MNNNEGNSKIIGIIGSVIFHGAIIAILFFTKLHASESDEGGGIIVAYGGAYEVVTDVAGGYIPPKVISSTEEITQESDEPSITTEEENKKREEAERAEQERKAREEQLRLEQERINNLVSGALSSSNSSATENKGSENGNSTTGAESGNVGYGSFDLGGRGLAKGETLPRPQYDNSNDEGTLVIKIIVSPAGKVISAIPNPVGSSGVVYNNGTLRARAVESARKAKFEVTKGNNNQEGSITYIFKQK